MNSVISAFKCGAIVRGGDQNLFHWKSPDWTLETKGEGVLISSYEDRDKWVRDVLDCQSLQEAIEVIKKSHPEIRTVLGVSVGQEECRASGFPIRFIHVAAIVS